MAKTCGIYRILSTTSGNFYIGSSLDIKYRWWRHNSDLKKGIHHSRILQRAFEKYGAEDFVYSILEECKEDMLLEREQCYLDELLPAYNICSEARNCKGKKDSNETKEKKRKIALELGIKPPKETWEKKQVKVVMCNNNMKEIETFVSLSDACRSVGRDHTYVSTITRAIKRKIKAYGYRWKYPEEIT